MRSTRKTTTTRQTAKLTLVALSLAVTLGGWAALAQEDNQPASLAPGSMVQTLDLPPIPTLAQPLAGGGFLAPHTQVSPPLDLPPIPAVSAPAPIVRPIARTRSSR